MLVVAVLVAGAWMAYTFGQEVFLSRHLDQEAAQLREENVALQAQNDGYRRDIVAMASGAAAEEEARLNGYARSDEKVYLVSAPPTPAPVQKRNKVVNDTQDWTGFLRRWLPDLRQR
jgi:cell division protein FtsB